MAVAKEKLKRIRYFSNGVWQFQPHLHFMQELVRDDARFADHLDLMEKNGARIGIGSFIFKMESDK